MRFKNHQEKLDNVLEEFIDTIYDLGVKYDSELYNDLQLCATLLLIEMFLYEKDLQGRVERETVDGVLKQISGYIDEAVGLEYRKNNHEYNGTYRDMSCVYTRISPKYWQ